MKLMALKCVTLLGGHIADITAKYESDRRHRNTNPKCCDMLWCYVLCNTKLSCLACVIGCTGWLAQECLDIYWNRRLDMMIVYWDAKMFSWNEVFHKCFACVMNYYYWLDHTDRLVQDCSNPIALTMVLLQTCTKPSVCCSVFHPKHLSPYNRK